MLTTQSRHGEEKREPTLKQIVAANRFWYTCNQAIDPAFLAWQRDTQYSDTTDGNSVAALSVESCLNRKERPIIKTLQKTVNVHCRADRPHKNNQQTSTLIKQYSNFRNYAPLGHVNLPVLLRDIFRRGIFAIKIISANMPHPFYRKYAPSLPAVCTCVCGGRSIFAVKN